MWGPEFSQTINYLSGRICNSRTNAIRSNKDVTMEVTQYWDDIDARLKLLVTDGFVKLPSLETFRLDGVAESINAEMNGDTFTELCSSHQLFLQDLCLENNLTPKLFEIARDILGYKGEMSNQYHIARRVEPGNSNEMFRAHFDSHLFTMVLPIKIPKQTNGGAVGELIYFPNARRVPKNEIINFVGKASHKRFASKEGIEKFAENHQKITDDFQDYSPLLFIGNTTLHTNKQVSSDCSSYRLTLLAHFFDPSPKYGVGGLLRLLRNR